MFDLKTTKIPATAQAVRARQEEAFQFQQARHLRSVNLLARGVAHDFNNILAAILSSAELVQMDLPPKNPGHEFLGQIFASGQRAREVVHQLRNFSQRRPGERTLISLAPVVEEGVRSLRATIPGAVEIMPQIGIVLPSLPTRRKSRKP